MSVFPHDESQQQADARAGGGGSGGGETKDEIVVAASPISPCRLGRGGHGRQRGAGVHDHQKSHRKESKGPGARTQVAEVEQEDKQSFKYL